MANVEKETVSFSCTPNEELPKAYLCDKTPKILNSDIKLPKANKNMTRSAASRVHLFSFLYVFLISTTSKRRFLAFVLCLGTNVMPAFDNVSLHFIHCS